MKNNKRTAIARAIKEGKWLEIHYRNESRHTTFWAAIKDINPNTKVFSCDMFNFSYIDNKNKGYILNTSFKFDKVISARVLDETTYQVPRRLLNKIDRDPERYDWLDFYLIDHNVLQYYLECYQEDIQIYEKDFDLVSGVDYSTLTTSNELKLDDWQFRSVLEIIKENIVQKTKTYFKQVKLAMNALGIYYQGKLFPIAYYPVLLHVGNRSLKITDEIRFNTYVNEFKLHEYLDVDLETFFIDYEHRRDHYAEMIIGNLNPGEQIDERPYIYRYETNLQVNLVSTYDAIVEMKKNNALTRPLKAFFGFSDRINRRRREYSLLLFDEKVNLPQLRVITNAVHQDVTYVQGPPGTGKTTTIFNTLLTAFYNNFTVLVTSHNNEAIDGIYNKFQALRYNNRPIPFPVLRLGNRHYVQKTIELLQKRYYEYIDFDIPLKKIEHELKRLKQDINREMTPVKEAILQFDEREDIKEKIDALETMIHQLKMKNTDPASLFRLEIDLADLYEKERKLSNIDEKAIIQSLQIPKKQLMKYLFYESLVAMKKFLKDEELISIITSNSEIDEKIKHFHHYIHKNIKKVLKIFPFIITTNISAQRLGDPSPSFDLLIMDEAGQCNVALSLIPLVRAERALFVGDPNQLKPIINLTDEKNRLLRGKYKIPSYYDYKENSILSTLLQVDQLSLYILLNEHFRCSPEIINFSNQKYYENQLVIRTKPNSDSLKFIDVEGVPGERKNTSLSEVEAVVEEVKKHPNQSIGIISPFRNQSQLITHVLKQHQLLTPNVKVGTIHTFQGNENDKIILSLGVTKQTYPGAYNWVKNNKELLNVATTRAKNSLVVIGDKRVLKDFANDENNDLLELVDYIDQAGNTTINNKADFYFTSRVINAKKYNTKAEKEFLDTISHILTTVQHLKVREKQKLTDVLRISSNDSFFKYANQAHFDFVLYNHQDEPLLAIEVMGLDHYTDDIVKQRDEKKKTICEKHNLQLYTVKNDYVRRYNMIRDTIIQVIRS